MKAKELYKFIISNISYPYEEREKDAICFIILDHFKISKTDFHLDLETKISDEDILKITTELNNGIPIQYLLGYCWFFGLKFKVNQHVLIPRQETEELCQLIIDYSKEHSIKSILDIGTGSGCIPITLKKNIEDANVHALDISEKALNLAKENANLNQAEINFHQCNILDEDISFEAYDTIVSNPPYIKWNEKASMETLVTDNEPDVALFVDNEDPLLFYKRIMNLASMSNSVENVFFEIHEQYGHEICSFIDGKKSFRCQLIKDINGKNRMIHAQKI